VHQKDRIRQLIESVINGFGAVNDQPWQDFEFQ
jgi:hypothetical protein